MNSDGIENRQSIKLSNNLYVISVNMSKGRGGGWEEEDDYVFSVPRKKTLVS